jgi:hypothetical protein
VAEVEDWRRVKQDQTRPARVLSSCGSVLSAKGLEQRSQWSRQLQGPFGTTGVTFPGVVAHAVEDPCGQGQGIPAFLAPDARCFPTLKTMDEVLQLAGQLIALVAIKLQHLEVPAKYFGSHQGNCGWIKLANIHFVVANFLRGLHERQVTGSKIYRGKSFWRPDSHLPHGGSIEPIGG